VIGFIGQDSSAELEPVEHFDPSSSSVSAVDRNGQRKFQKDFVVKGAKRRLRRSRTLDNKILLKHTATVAIDGFL